MTDSERNVKLLRYGEIIMRKARDEATEEELGEMAMIRQELNLTPAEIILEVEALVKKKYR